MLNIMFTLLLGLVGITAFDKLDKKYYFSIPIVGLCIYLGYFLKVDYGWYGVATVFVLYLFRTKKIMRIFAFAIVSFIFYYSRLIQNYSIQSLISYLCLNVSTILLYFYNGKLGHKTKYLYYVFYPLHMLIFYIIRSVVV